MSCDCSSLIGLKEGINKDFLASSNVSFELAVLLWADKAKTIPFDLTGYHGRGAIGVRNGANVTELMPMTVTIAMDSQYTLIYGVVTKANIETLPTLKPLVYDMTVETDDLSFSFTLIWGNLIFNPLPGA